MPRRNVVLTDHQEEPIDKLVGSGRYQNAREVLREELRLVKQREAEDAAKLKALRKAGRERSDVDIIGSVDELPCDFRTKKYLKSTGYSDKRTR